LYRKWRAVGTYTFPDLFLPHPRRSAGKKVSSRKGDGAIAKWPMAKSRATGNTGSHPASPKAS
jgi:hypothetical protein